MRRLLSPVCSLTAILVCAPSALAQSEPYKVFDTRPVITQGPYLVATAGTTTTIVWLTDTPSHSMVRYARGAGLAAARASSTSRAMQAGAPCRARHGRGQTG